MPTLHWIGKDKIINHHQEVPYKVLDHEYGFSESGKTETTIERGNLIINGDNLEALKSLLPKYEGKVNCIYIDPPYNTGNESWVYNDNVNAPQIKKWLGKVVGKESEDLTRHDKWLCMMYPRLKLLHKLLSKNGFIFISLDDNEIHSMKFMLNEIFGEKNFQAEIIVQSNKRGQTYKQIAKTNEYLICFSKSEFSNINELPTEVGEYPYEDDLGKYSIRELRNRNPKFGRFNRPNLFFPIYINPKNPDNNGFCPISLKKDDDFVIEVLPLNSQKEESCWRWGTKKVDENITHENDMDSIFGKPKQDGSWGIYDKYRKGTVKAKTIWTETEMISEQGTALLRNLGLAEVFQFPKPIELIKRVLLLGTDENSIVLDSFAGSGTTAHAVLDLNKKDGGNRKFILIEMEDYAETITSERVKRGINGCADVEGTGGGFNYYTLGEPLFDDNNNLNETVGIGKIREYVWFTETRSTKTIAKNVAPYMGIHNDTAYYFIYDQNSLTTLDYESLASHIQQKAERYIIYADNCLLPETFLREKNIEFKKIPRDITRF